MAHLIQPAPTARAKCRGCGERIGAGELRFGENLPNPFADGETTHWFHLDCAAYKRPEPFLETLEARTEPLEDGERLGTQAKLGVTHRRLPRVAGAERSPSGRAQCRSCRNNIEKGAWRLSLVFYQEGRFAPAGYIHAACATEYLETIDVLPRLERFSPHLTEQDKSELRTELEDSAHHGRFDPDTTP
jgi:hypothetical protein